MRLRVPTRFGGAQGEPTLGARRSRGVLPGGPPAGCPEAMKGANLSKPELLEQDVQRANRWLDELAAELGSDDRAQAARVLRAHLHAIRDGMGVEDVAWLGGRLPQLVRGIFYEGWVPAPEATGSLGADALLTRFGTEAGLAPGAESSAACSAASRVLRRHVAAADLDELIARAPAALEPLLTRDATPDAAQTEPTASPSPATGFARVLCGIDSSPEAIEALRQASVLADEDARILGVSVWDPVAAAHGSHPSPQLIDFVRDRASSALADAEELLPGLQARLIRGSDVAAVVEVATSERADLIAVGPHSHSRAAGIALGSVATAVVHRAPCSVLIARRTDQASRFPDRIIHAGDGSSDSKLAATVAGRIAARHGSRLTTLYVDSGSGSTRKIVEEAGSLIEAIGGKPVLEVRSGRPHRRIVEAAEESQATLVVLGSRGLSGVRALGSVSERVAHQAPCSVLIVRDSESTGSRDAAHPTG